MRHFNTVIVVENRDEDKIDIRSMSRAENYWTFSIGANATNATHSVFVDNNLVIDSGKYSSACCTESRHSFVLVSTSDSLDISLCLTKNFFVDFGFIDIVVQGLRVVVQSLLDKFSNFFLNWFTAQNELNHFFWLSNFNRLALFRSINHMLNSIRITKRR